MIQAAGYVRVDVLIIIGAVCVWGGGGGGGGVGAWLPGLKVGGFFMVVE